jgi:hypothetical protein
MGLRGTSSRPPTDQSADGRKAKEGADGLGCFISKTVAWILILRKEFYRHSFYRQLLKRAAIMTLEQAAN